MTAWLIQYLLWYTCAHCCSTLQYCFTLASILDHIKNVSIVKKNVDKCSEYILYQVTMKSLEKRSKNWHRQNSNMGVQLRRY